MKALMLRRKRGMGVLRIPENKNLEKKLIAILGISIVSLGIIYGYFVKQTIFNVVARKETEEKIADLGSRVSQLEVEYIELKNKIGLDFAYSLGYREISEIKFVSRSVLNKSLTINEN